MTLRRISISTLGTAAALALLAAAPQAWAQDADPPAEPQVQDSVTVDGNQGAVNGRLAVNIASGSGNQELNGAAFAIGDIAVTDTSAHQLIAGEAPGDRATQITLAGNAFSNIAGMGQINVAAGSQNQAANTAGVAIGKIEALSEDMLSQSRASTKPSGSSGGSAIPNDGIAISDTAFANNSGLIQANLIGGEGNSSANTFVLDVLDAGSP